MWGVLPADSCCLNDEPQPRTFAAELSPFLPEVVIEGLDVSPIPQADAQSHHHCVFLVGLGVRRYRQLGARLQLGRAGDSELLPVALQVAWGAVAGVPWSLLAAVGSVESGHGSNPSMLVPHDARRARPDAVPGGLEPAREEAGQLRRPGVRRHVGPMAHGLGPSAVPHGRPGRRDRRRRCEAALRRRARCSTGSKALYHYSALGAYVSLVLKRAPPVPARLLRAGPSSSISTSISTSTTTTSSTAVPAASASQISSTRRRSSSRRGCLRPEQRHRRLAAHLAPRSGSRSAGSIAISEFKHRHSKYVDRHDRRSRTTGTDAPPRSPGSTASAVSPGSAAARTLWHELRTAPAAIRPIEIGAPWADPANSRYYSGSDART